VNGDDDWTLIRRCRKGAVRAFEPLVRRYEGRALGYAAALLGDDADAEDAVQEAFIRAHGSLDRLEAGSSFWPWLRAIIRNLCLDRLGSAARRRERRWPEPGEGGPPLSRPPDELRSAARRELAEGIREAVKELSPEHREILVLREMDGFDYGEIARELEISPGTVASRLHHARRSLREILERRGVTPESMIL